MFRHVLGLCFVVWLFGSFLSAQTCKYQPGSHPEKLSPTDCTSRCLPGPLKITPSPIEACEGETIHPNIFVENNALTNSGDGVVNAFGSVAWDDGKEDGLSSCCTWYPTHSYVQA